MKICPFLTTTDSNISCFNDCAFYNKEAEGSDCPFLSVTGTGTRREEINFMNYKGIIGQNYLYEEDLFSEKDYEAKETYNEIF